MKWKPVHVRGGAETRIWHLVLAGDIRVSVHRYIGDSDGWYVSCPALTMDGVSLGKGLTADDAREAGFTAAKATAKAIYRAFEDAAK